MKARVLLSTLACAVLVPAVVSGGPATPTAFAELGADGKVILNRPMERVGTFLGGLFAPFVVRAGKNKKARLLHTTGVTYQATVRPLTYGGRFGAASSQFSGQGLVRLSTATTPLEGEEKPDVLGFAVRITDTGAPIGATPREGDQDLVLASGLDRFRHLVVASKRTNPHDFLANTYHGATKFDLVGVGPVWIRVAPAVAPPASAPAESRTARLERAVREGRAIFRLEVQLADGPQDWVPLAEIRLTAPLTIDQAQIQFSAIRGGRGLEARGFIQALRASIYVAAQRGRAAAAPRALEAAPSKGILGTMGTEK